MYVETSRSDLPIQIKDWCSLLLLGSLYGRLTLLTLGEMGFSCERTGLAVDQGKAAAAGNVIT